MKLHIPLFILFIAACSRTPVNLQVADSKVKTELEKQIKMAAENMPKINLEKVYIQKIVNVKGRVLIEMHSKSLPLKNEIIKLQKGPRVLGETTSDENGNFSFDEYKLEEGHYLLKIESPHFQGQEMVKVYDFGVPSKVNILARKK